jgi:hypothetical protein
MGNGEPAPAKKGLPVWAWIGIGCGALIVLVLIVVTIGGVLVANKVKDVAADFEKNPAMATARMIVKLNPELEEVSTDEEEGTITVRNTKTGEETTVNFEDIEDGKFSFKTGDREITVDATGLEDTGSIKVTDDEGAVVFSTGETSAEDIPPWVPVYPGTEPTSRHTMRNDENLTGGFEVVTTDRVAVVLEFYRTTLEGAGYKISVNTFSQDDSEGGMVNGRHESEQRSVVVILNSEEGSTKVVVSYNQGS